MNQNTENRAFRAAPWKEEGDFFERIRECFFISLTTILIIGWLGSLFEWNDARILTFFMILFLAGSFSFLEKAYPDRRNRKILFGIYAILPLLMGILPPVFGGFSGLIHDTKKTLAHQGIYLSYGTSDAVNSWNRSLALLCIAVWIFLMMNYILKKNGIIGICLLLLVFFLQIRYGEEEGAVYFLLWTMVLLLSYLTTMRAYVYLMVPLTILGLIFSFTFGLSVGDGWRTQWKHLRYHDDANVLPEGDLNKAKHLQRSEEEAFLLSDTANDFYYLKGFVGNVYKDNQWTNNRTLLDDFEVGILSNNPEFLSWLHDKGCSGWNQLAQSSKKNPEKVISIKNAKANRKYVYLPYELSTPLKELENGGIAVSQSGEALLAQGLFGQKSYQITSLTSLSESGNQTAADKAGKSWEYDAYEEYVKRTCLMLPKEVKEKLRAMTNGQSTIGIEDPLSQVLKVRRWIDRHISYKEEIEKIPEGEEFIQWFLDGHSEGYDVHYATIAVMLFRYYGIPSRYVEGYLVTGGKKVKQKDAHAWPEIYISGRGWIPVEVMERYEKLMPSYLGEDHLQEENSGDEEKKRESKSAGNQEKKDQKHQRNSSAGVEKESNSSVQEETDLTSIPVKERKISSSFLYLILFLLIIIMILFFRILHEFLKKRAALEGPSPEVCVIMWYAYCSWLLYELENNSGIKETMLVDNRLLKWEERWTKYHPKVKKSSLRQAGLLRQKAIYRPGGIEWEEADSAIAFLENEYKYLYKQLSRLKKLKVKLGIRPAFLRKNES